MVEEMNESQSISVLKTYTNHIIKSFGPNKIMYGSNWPVCLTKKSYSEVLDIAKKISINVDSEKFFYNSDFKVIKKKERLKSFKAFKNLN